MKTSRSSERSQLSKGVGVERRTRGSRRPEKNIRAAAAPALPDTSTDAKHSSMNMRSEFKSSSSIAGQSAAICRLCHGTFSSRSLRHAFNKWPQDSVNVFDDASCSSPPPLFHADFQQLVGVRLDPDPRLSEFVCKKCHSKFYKCHRILIRFLQTVNVPPIGAEHPISRHGPVFPEAPVKYGSTSSPSFSPDLTCLHKLVSWAHQHGEACKSCPDLKEVLEGTCWGFVKAVWCCVDGHSYTMDTQCTTSSKCGRVPNSGGDVEECQERRWPGIADAAAQRRPSAVIPQSHGSTPADCNTGVRLIAYTCLPPPPLHIQQSERSLDAFPDLRVFSEEEFEERRKSLSEDELFETYSDQRTNKQRQMSNVSWEPKVKKKPGPKPGWKNKFKAKVEELPNIYKCPYEGCAAVYRAPDGLKKHRKEHHDEVRERPCPHPGCNKVFTIERYLQRHVKLIHTEERNYICDQCGQTFKQRKHLSVHQMRHSGAKPLQCEVCGFQCRQRASLKYHMTKHMAEADLEFACVVCSKRFEKAHNLNVHMSMVHPLTQRHVHKEAAHR